MSSLSNKKKESRRKKKRKERSNVAETAKLQLYLLPLSFIFPCLFLKGERSRKRMEWRQTPSRVKRRHRVTHAEHQRAQTRRPLHPSAYLSLSLSSLFRCSITAVSPAPPRATPGSDNSCTTATVLSACQQKQCLAKASLGMPQEHRQCCRERRKKKEQVDPTEQIEMKPASLSPSPPPSLRID